MAADLAGEKATLGGKPWPLFKDPNGAVKLADGLRMSSLEGKDKRAQVSLIVRGRGRVDGGLRPARLRRPCVPAMNLLSRPKPDPPCRARKETMCRGRCAI